MIHALLQVAVTAFKYAENTYCIEGYTHRTASDQCLPLDREKSPVVDYDNDTGGTNMRKCGASYSSHDNEYLATSSPYYYYHSLGSGSGEFCRICPNQQPDASYLACVDFEEPVPDCDAYGPLGLCSVCVEGFRLAEGNQCVDVGEIPGCELYAQSAQACARCAPQFIPRAGGCTPVNEFNCALSDGLRCVRCAVGYSLGADAACTLKACLPCAPGDAACRGANAGLQCDADGIIQSGTRTNCPATQYYDYFSNKCESCGTNCTCRIASRTCTGCVNGYYLSADSCKTCTDNCNKCSSQSTCTACKSGWRLQNGKCTDCDTGYFMNNKVCQKCSENCKECVGALGNCTVCQSGSQLAENFTATMHQCVEEGNIDQIRSNCDKLVSESNYCEKCKEFHFLAAGQCYYIENCLSYLDYRGSANLSGIDNIGGISCKCNDGYFLARKGNITGKLACSKCPDNMRVCKQNSKTGDTGICEKQSDCDAKYFCTAAGKCDSLMLHCLEQSSISICEKCESKFNSSQQCAECPVYCPDGCGHNNTCFSQCETGYYMQDQKCEKCSLKCDFCDSNTTCTKCTEGYDLVDKECKKACDNTSYRDPVSKQCYNCLPNCAQCNATGTCQLCKNRYWFDGKLCQKIPSVVFKNNLADQIIIKEVSFSIIVAVIVVLLVILVALVTILAIFNKRKEKKEAAQIILIDKEEDNVEDGAFNQSISVGESTTYDDDDYEDNFSVEDDMME